MATQSILNLDVLRDPFLGLLQRSSERVPGWMGALVATVDGREVAVHHTETIEAARVSAMLGSVVALGDTVCRELKFGRSQSLMVSANGGHLLALRIPAEREVLSALPDDLVCRGKRNEMRKSLQRNGHPVFDVSADGLFHREGLVHVCTSSCSFAHSVGFGT